MKTRASAYFRLFVFDFINETEPLYFADSHLAKEEYSEKLKELQDRGLPFQITLKLVYVAEGSHSFNYFLSGHNENGEFWKNEVEADKQILKRHIASGFFSANPKVLFPVYGWRD